MPRYVSVDGFLKKKIIRKQSFICLHFWEQKLNKWNIIKAQTTWVIFGTGADVSAQMTDKILEAQRLSGIFQSDKVSPT